MVALADEYLADEKILSRRMSSSGSGASLLGLIGFEIYLKAIVLLETRHRSPTHDFLAIWNKLPKSVAEEILGDAENRYTVHTHFSNFEAIMVSLKRAFKIGRYSYEINDDRSNAEVTEAGKLWTNEGGKTEEADFAYYPMERAALIHALRSYWKKRSKTE